MSVIAWLFGLGALSVAFPFLFHLIRRTPTGQTNFSSLMFLKPSPPRLTKRSRLENWLLLLLRCGVLLALALAFMRPFFRDGTQVPLANVPGRNVAILLDTSASMKRGELFADAIEEAKRLLTELNSQDRIALFSFDRQLNRLTSFPESLEAFRRDSMASKLNELSPTWHRGNLGSAIASVADQLSELNERDQLKTTGQIFVISDFQKSSQISALQSINWPANVKLESLPVKSDVPNASVQILKDSPDSAQINAARVRIRNSNLANQEQFKLDWGSKTDEPTLDYYVPSNSAEIFSLPFPAETGKLIRLRGEENDPDYDNQFYFVPPEKRKRTVLVLGDDDPNDPEELRYYFDAAMKADNNTDSLIGTTDEIADSTPQMILVTDPLDDAATIQVNEFLESGGLVSFVAYDQQRVESFAQWIGGELDEEVKRREKYHLLADIDFEHPMFANFDSAGMNDFTGIKFWEHSRVKLSDPSSNRILAAFDDESPAIWTRSAGNGKVVCFAFGWQPEKSQFALSPKFLPIIFELVELAANERDPVEGLLVGQTIPLDPEWDSSSIRLPSGDQINTNVGQTRFAETDSPGVYEIIAGGESVASFAVNLDPAESDFQTLGMEQLEAYGVSLGEQATAEEKAEQLRALKDTQLEDQQKIWKWAIILAMALIAAETYVASRRPKVTLAADLAGTAA